MAQALAAQRREDRIGLVCDVVAAGALERCTTPRELTATETIRPERVLYDVYTGGHAGRVDLAGEAIRLARQLTFATEEPEARGLLALMHLNHARLPARLDSEGRIVTLDRQDRGRWETRKIARACA